jgi:hypothetical protein
MFVLVFNQRQMCFNDDAIAKCMSEKISPFGTTSLAMLSSTPLPHKFETSRISGSLLTCKRGSAIFTMFGFDICTPLNYTLHYEYQNNNPTTNLQLLSIMTSRKMIAKQIDFEDIFPQDISTCLVSMYIDQINVAQEDNLRDGSSLDVLANVLQLDLIL